MTMTLHFPPWESNHLLLFNNNEREQTSGDRRCDSHRHSIRHAPLLLIFNSLFIPFQTIIISLLLSSAAAAVVVVGVSGNCCYPSPAKSPGAFDLVFPPFVLTQLVPSLSLSLCSGVDFSFLLCCQTDIDKWKVFFFILFLNSLSFVNSFFSERLGESKEHSTHWVLFFFLSFYSPLFLTLLRRRVKEETQLLEREGVTFVPFCGGQREE